MDVKSTSATRRFAVLAFLALALWPSGVQSGGAPARTLDVVYEPTPQPVVRAMLRLAKVGPDDFLIDLGCGDGRIPITAAKLYGTRGLGVDLDPARIEEARANAEVQGVADKVSLVEGDLFGTNLDKASVIALFLYPDINLKLRPRLLDLAPGTRVVSHAHDMGDWRPDAKRMLMGSAVYYWVVPANIGGKWQLIAGDRSFSMHLAQKYQRFVGTASTDGEQSKIRNGLIDGPKVSFMLALAGGKVQRLAGQLNSAGDLAGPNWTATRVE